MTFSPTAAREALAAQIKSVINSSAQRANVHAFPQGSPQLNAILLYPRAGEDGLYLNYRLTFGPRSVMAMRLWVEIRVGGDSPSADMEMDRYLTPGTDESVFDAIEADRTLGLEGVDCTVENGATAPGWFEPTVSDGTGRTWLMSRIPVEITGTR